MVMQLKGMKVTINKSTRGLCRKLQCRDSNITQYYMVHVHMDNAVIPFTSAVLQGPLRGRQLLCEAGPSLLPTPPLTESRECSLWNVYLSEDIGAVLTL